MPAATKKGSKTAAIKKAVIAVLARQKKEQQVGLDHRAVLLTGATGFLGAFLLNELLKQTQAKVYCLVRASDDVAGKERLWKSLQNYQLSTRPVFESRVVPLVGDLGKTHFGLDKRLFLQIGHEIDAIIHNGCLVNFMCPFEQLKGPNVHAVADVIRLSTIGGHKNATPIHYVSSLSVYGAGADRKIMEGDELPPSSDMQGGGAYTQTKWVAEKMLEMARADGVPVSIHRPGRILGDSANGTCNDSDFMFRMLKGSAQLGYFPQISWSEMGSPVDYVAKAIVYISRHPASKSASAYTTKANYNLVDSEPMTYAQMFAWMTQCGYAMQKCTFDEWKKRMAGLSEDEAMANAMYSLLPVVSEQGEDGDTMPLFDCSNTLTLLRGSGIVCPRMNRQVLGHYLDHIEGIYQRKSQMRQSYLLPAKFLTAEAVTHAPSSPFEADDDDHRETFEAQRMSMELTFGRQSSARRSTLSACRLESTFGRQSSARLSACL